MQPAAAVERLTVLLRVMQLSLGDLDLNRVQVRLSRHCMLHIGTRATRTPHTAALVCVAAGAARVGVLVFTRTHTSKDVVFV